MTYIPLVLVFIILLAQILTIRYELTSDYFIKTRHTGEDWYIHHDEKIALSDGRYLYLRKIQPDLDIWDFLPQPPAVAFGILPPIVMCLGFKLFGFNNVGLRLINLLITAMTNIMIVITVFNILTPLLAFITCCLLLLNWNYFILTRHFVLENILTLYFTALIFLFFCHPQHFASDLLIISFLASSVILTKINFPVYVFALLIPLSVSSQGISGFVTALVGFLVGTAFFEMIQIFLLSRYGLAKCRYSNLFIALKVHSGRQKSMGVRLKPLGLKTFYSTINLFLEWFGLKKGIIKIEERMNAVYAIIVISILLSLLLLSYKTNTGAEVLYLFIILYVLSLCPMHFYLKRLVSIFPLIIVAIAMSIQGLQITIPPEGYKGLDIFLIGVTVVIICTQLVNAYKMYSKRSQTIHEFSNNLEGLIPDRQVIYSHCYGFRFLWMVKKHRFRFADDNTMNNQEIIDWAIREQGSYVIITSGGSKINEHSLPLIKPIMIYSTTASDSDIPEGLVLCKINL